MFTMMDIFWNKSYNNHDNRIGNMGWLFGNKFAMHYISKVAVLVMHTQSCHVASEQLSLNFEAFHRHKSKFFCIHNLNLLMWFAWTTVLVLSCNVYCWLIQQMTNGWLAILVIPQCTKVDTKDHYLSIHGIGWATDWDINKSNVSCSFEANRISHRVNKTQVRESCVPDLKINVK